MLIALKLLLAPFFIALVSLAGRRWGPTVTGMLSGLPLTSGPISLLLALQYGPEFAASAAAGNLAGQASTCIFCLVYSLVALRSRWPASSLAGLAAYFAIVFLSNQVPFPLLVAFAILLPVFALTLRLMPRAQRAPTLARPPAWDLPARMLAATAFVLLLTTSARWIGPRMSGLLSPFPVFGLVLSVFTHRQEGGASAARLLRGIVVGSTAYTAFFLVVGLLLPVLPIAPSYLLATLAMLCVNLVSFYRARAVIQPGGG